MTDNWETLLPYSLQNPEDKSKIKDFTTQWSQLIAWSWVPLLAFEGDKGDQECTLKRFFNRTLQKQGLNTIAYEVYDYDNAKEDANLFSDYIQKMLLGKNDEIPYLKEKGIKVTLAEVLKKLSGQDFVCTEYPEFTKMSIYRVTPEYTPEITEVGYRQYVTLLPYPPRPALSNDTVTKDQLCDWAKNEKAGGDYLPPSLYIPIAGL